MPSNASASAAPATPAPEAKTGPAINVTVPQESGTIILNTFDRKTPHRFTVENGVIDAPDQAAADLLVARVDGASLAS